MTLRAQHLTTRKTHPEGSPGYVVLTNPGLEYMDKMLPVWQKAQNENENGLGIGSGRGREQGGCLDENQVPKPPSGPVRNLFDCLQKARRLMDFLRFGPLLVNHSLKRTQTEGSAQRWGFRIIVE